MREAKINQIKYMRLLLMLMLAVQNTLPYGIKRVSGYSAASTIGEGIPIGNDKTKLGKLVILMTPTYRNQMLIWDFTNFKTTNPPVSVISNTSNAFINDSNAFNLINNNVLVYTSGSNAYTFCQFTPSATLNTRCTPTFQGTLRFTDAYQKITSSIVLDATGATYTTMYVCILKRNADYPHIECLLGGASPTSPLTELPIFDYNLVSDLNQNPGDFVFKVINKSIYGFRLAVSNRN